MSSLILQTQSVTLSLLSEREVDAGLLWGMDYMSTPNVMVAIECKLTSLKA